MRKLGRVIEVYLPVGEELTKVGFKIQIKNEIIDIVAKQTMDNAKIYRDDFVFVEINDAPPQTTYIIKSINEVELEDAIDE